jgi:hypothetical protein
MILKDIVEGHYAENSLGWFIQRRFTDDWHKHLWDDCLNTFIFLKGAYAPYMGGSKGSPLHDDVVLCWYDTYSKGYTLCVNYLAKREEKVYGGEINFYIPSKSCYISGAIFARTIASRCMHISEEALVSREAFRYSHPSEHIGAINSAIPNILRDTAYILSSAYRYTYGLSTTGKVWAAVSKIPPYIRYNLIRIGDPLLTFQYYRGTRVDLQRALNEEAHMIKQQKRIEEARQSGKNITSLQSLKIKETTPEFEEMIKVELLLKAL